MMMTQQTESLPCQWPLGRPPKYKPELCEDLVEKMGQGLSNIRISADWGIAESTFYEWVNTYQEFSDAYTLGKTKWEAWWEEFGYKLMTGREKGEFKAWIAYMNRKFHWSGTNPVHNGDTVHIGNINMLSLDPKEIDKKLENLMDKYSSTSIKDLKQKLLNDGSEGQETAS